MDEAIARARASSPSLPNRIISSLPSTASRALEDSEDWLSLDEEGLEDMLRARGPGEDGLGDLDLSDDDEEEESDDEEGMEGVEVEGGDKEEERKAKKMARTLQGMAGKVEEFIHGRGAVDGAEFSE